MTETLTAEAVQQTQQAYLTAATQTGELRGTVVEFTVDGKEWAPVIFDLAEGAHPIAARATVYREGWVVPTVVTVLWEEAMPADEAWSGLWLARPHVLFGAFALRAALRRAFADVLGDRREPDDLPSGIPERTTSETAVDWYARIGAVATEDDLNALRAEARAARVIDLDMKRALDERRAALVADAWKPEADPTPASTYDKAKGTAVAERAPVSERPARLAPQDHLPSNRAARRARKKGRR